MKSSFLKFKNRTITRWLLVVGAVVVAGSGVGAASLALQPEGGSPTDSAGVENSAADSSASTRRVRVTQVIPLNESPATIYPGTVRSSQKVQLAFRVGGPLVQIAVTPGDRVRKGDVLMAIDARDFQNSQAAAQAALDAASARLEAMRNGAREEDILALEAGIDAAIARRDYLQTERNRHNELVSRKAVARSLLESYESQLAASLADLRAKAQVLRKAKTGARREDILAAEADVRALQTALKVATDQLNDSTLRSPMDGVVSKQLVENFENVESGKPVLVIQNLSTIEIDVDLPDKEMVYRDLNDKMVVKVSFPAVVGRDFQATFKEIDTDADTSTRTYRVTFAMKTPNNMNLLPGMICDVSIPSPTAADMNTMSIGLPASAISSDSEGERYIWIVSDESTVSRQTVTVGRLHDSGDYEVLSGVSPGQTIVCAGAAFLHEGAQVEVSASEDRPQAPAPSESGS